MKHLFLMLILIFTSTTWAQTPQGGSASESIKRAMELREELHRRLRDHLFNGDGTDEDIFKDMETLFNDVMSDMGSLSSPASPRNFDMAWTESKDGRTLLISPQQKDQRLDISVEKEMITIKGKSEKKVGTSTSVSSFTHSYGVPQDCDPSKVKMLEKAGKIMMVFPFKVAPKQETRKPLKKVSSEVTI